MSRRIELQPHLSTDELYERYRACRRPNEKTRWRALHLISRGALASEAARRVGRTSGWVTQLTNATTSAAPGPCPTSGAKLSPAGRRWSRPWPRNSTPPCARPRPTAGPGRPLRWRPGSRSAPADRCTRRRRGGPCAASASRSRRRARATPARPRRASRGGLKKLKATAAALRRWHPDETVEVWGEDEARLGLKPILRRVWAPRGERPPALHHPRYEWLWVFAAVHPQTGRVFWLVLPHLAAGMMQLFLDEFAREHAPAGKRVVLVVDGASAHRAKSLRVPERLTLVSLPAYTSELNPAERLWPLQGGRGEPGAPKSGFAGGGGLRTLSKNHGRAGRGAHELPLVAGCMNHLILFCKSVLVYDKAPRQEFL